MTTREELTEQWREARAAHSVLSGRREELRRKFFTLSLAAAKSPAGQAIQAEVELLTSKMAESSARIAEIRAARGSAQ